MNLWKWLYCFDCGELRWLGPCYCVRVAEYREGIEEDEQISGESPVIVDPYWDKPQPPGVLNLWAEFEDGLQEDIANDYPA